MLAFALLAAYTALSIIWSLSPSDSWLETNRTLAYLAVFAGGVALVRLAPGRWAAMLYGVLAGAVVVCAWALLTKIFPAALAPDETLARLRAPFEYWNSVGLMAALGVPPLLWLAARRTGQRRRQRARLAAARARSRLPDAVLLARRAARARRSGSRSGSRSCRCGCARSPRCCASALAAVPVVAVGVRAGRPHVDRAPIAARVDAGHELGALLLLLVAC